MHESIIVFGLNLGKKKLRMRLPARLLFWVLVSILALAIVFAFLRGYFTDVAKMLAQKLEIVFK